MNIRRLSLQIFTMSIQSSEKLVIPTWMKLFLMFQCFFLFWKCNDILFFVSVKYFFEYFMLTPTTEYCFLLKFFLFLICELAASLYLLGYRIISANHLQSLSIQSSEKYLNKIVSNTISLGSAMMPYFSSQQRTFWVLHVDIYNWALLPTKKIVN